MGTYEFLHPLPLCEHVQKETLEDWRSMEDRNRPLVCKCGVKCPRVPSVPLFNPIFPGSTRADHLAQKLTQESIIAQDEGFRSKDEIQTAIGMAEERAKQSGTPGKQLIGPVASPFREVQGKKTFDPVNKPKDNQKIIKNSQEARRGR